jgi:hypothetical protein
VERLTGVGRSAFGKKRSFISDHEIKLGLR